MNKNKKYDMNNMTGMNTKSLFANYHAGLLFVMLLLCVAIATALPLAPNIPPGIPPENTASFTVSITSPSTGAEVNSTFTVVYSHNALSLFNCNLYANTTLLDSYSTMASRTVSVTLGNGSYSLNVSCSNATTSMSSTPVVVDVRNASGGGVIPPQPSTTKHIILLYPGETAKTNLNVTYKHNSTGRLNCSVYLEPSTPIRELSGRNLAYNTVVVEKFSGVTQRVHRLDITCRNSTWTETFTRNVNVTNETTQVVVFQGLTVKPTKVTTGERVRINGTFYGNSEVNIVIKKLTSIRNQTVVITNPEGEFSYLYTVPYSASSGVYTVTANTIDDPDIKKNGTFTVDALTPRLSVVGSIKLGSPVTISGEKFWPNDELVLKLTGANSNDEQENSTNTTSTGTLLFTYNGLTAQRYTLIVSSKTYFDVLAELVFNVTNTSTTNSTTNKTITPGPIVVPGPVVPDDTPTDTGSNHGPIITTPDEQTGGSQNPLGNDPTAELPSDNLNPSEIDTQTVDSSSSSFRWLWFLIIGVVIIGGILGYLVYNGTLDVSSMDAFKESVNNIMSGNMATPKETIGESHSFKGGFDDAVGNSKNAMTDSVAASNNTAEMTSFIKLERSRGFDDLTIRGTLIAKGWEKQEVDSVFDSIYKEQQRP